MKNACFGGCQRTELMCICVRNVYVPTHITYFTSYKDCLRKHLEKYQNLPSLRHRALRMQGVTHTSTKNQSTLPI